MQLNPQQMQAVNHRRGPALVVACPGSGKTRVIVERTVKMIQEGIPAHRILSLTFTNKAAGEMKERVTKELGKTPDKMFMGTFHSLASHILRRMGHHRGLSKDFTIMDDSDQKTLVRKVAKKLYEDDYKTVLSEVVLPALNDARENCQDPEESLKDYFHDTMASSVTADRHYAVAVQYMKEMKANNLMDFSGLLYEMYLLLEECEPARECLQKSIDFIQLDEVQDTNYIQFRIVEKLAENHHNILVVGDLNQSVYAFRGARYKNITDFVAYHKDCKIIELGMNYRSTPEITAVADKLIVHNKSNMGGTIKTSKLSGNPVVYMPFETSETESTTLANQILTWMSQGKYSPSDVAVLYRANAMSRSVEEAFRKVRVPYKLVGGFSFYDRSEIKDCFSMLRLAVNKHDTVAFTRLADFMPGMGEKSVHKIEEQAKASGKSFVEMCGIMKDQVPSGAKESCELISRAYSQDLSKAKTSDALAHLVATLKYEATISKSAKKGSDDRIDNVRELMVSTMSSENNNRGISEYLQQMQLLGSNDEKEENGKVTLMSMHASKGLEFPIVFIIGVEENLLPHERSLREGPEALEEERRLFYVGITRAKDKLFLSSCQNRRKVGGRTAPYYRCTPSRFLVESGLVKI